jgi:hypothetical protein
LFVPEMVQAQCAMCKAVVESNARSDDSVVAGVNNAVMYLMGIPYALIAVIAFVWYKKFLKSETGN